MEKESFGYLVAATNQIHQVLMGSLEPSEDDVRKVFAIGCNTLKRATAHAEVEADLKLLAARQEQFLAQYKAIAGSVGHFVNGFCAIEKRAMIKAGISEAASDSLIQEAIRLRESVSRRTINPDEVLKNIRTLRDETCAIAKRLQETPIEREERRKAKKRLKRLAAGIGGIAIVAIDASTLVVSIGMSLPGTAVSGGVGSGLIGASVVID